MSKDNNELEIGDQVEVTGKSRPISGEHTSIGGVSIDIIDAEASGTKKDETYWRNKIADEIYEFANQLQREANNSGVGVAAYAIVQEVGNRVGRMK